MLAPRLIGEHPDKRVRRIAGHAQNIHKPPRADSAVMMKKVRRKIEPEIIHSENRNRSDMFNTVLPPRRDFGPLDPFAVYE